jgi:hypothetical protein
MAGQQDFDCPSCAAALRVTGYETQVRCEYCGTTVVVPPELRHPPPPAYPPPPPPVYHPPPLYAPPPAAPRPSSTASTAMVLGLIGVPLSCFFLPLGLPLSISALVLAASYNNQRRQHPHAPAHPADAGRIRVAQLTAALGLALFTLACLGILGLNLLAPFLGVDLATPAPTPRP